jgi:hypothetical protein
MVTCSDIKIAPRTTTVARNKYKYSGQPFPTFKKGSYIKMLFSNFEFRYGLSPFQFIGPENGGKIYMAHKQKCWHASAPQGGYGLAL